MICVDTTVLIDEFRAKGDLSAPVNRALIAHGAETLIVPAAAAGEFFGRSRDGLAGTRAGGALFAPPAKRCSVRS